MNPANQHYNNCDPVASNCSTGNYLSNFNKRISSNNSNRSIWARWRLPTVSSPLPIVTILYEYCEPISFGQNFLGRLLRFGWFHTFEIRSWSRVSGGGMIRLETLIELKSLHSSFSSSSSDWNSKQSFLSSNSRQPYLSQQYPTPLLESSRRLVLGSPRGVKSAGLLFPRGHFSNEHVTN